MSYSDNFYLAVANQLNFSVNSPIVAGTNNENVNIPLGPTCRVCADNYCYQDAEGYNSSGAVLNSIWILPGDNCAYTNTDACSVGSPQSSEQCRFNGTMQDWQYDTVLCTTGVGGTYPVCSTVDPSLCTLYNSDFPTDVSKSYTKYIYNTLTTPCTPNSGTGSSCSVPVPDSYDSFVNWNNNADRMNDIEDGRYVNCNYNKRTFVDNVGIIKSYYSSFIDPSSKIYAADTKGKANTQNMSNYNQIMQDFSSSVSSDADAICPLYTIYPYNSTQPSKCSRFVATGEGGDWVRGWTAGTQVSGTTPPVSAFSDNAKIAYCSDQANFNSPECQCINRTTVDKNYTVTQQILDAPPACWYIPCQDSSKYLITSDISSTLCSSSVCQNVSINIANSGGQITDNEMQTISCTVNDTDTSNNTGIFNGNFKIPIWVWIILAIIFIIIIIGIGVLLFRNSNKKKE